MIILLSLSSVAFKKIVGNSLAVQWLLLCASTAGGPGLVPGRGTGIPQSVWCGQKKKNCNMTIYLCDYLDCKLQEHHFVHSCAPSTLTKCTWHGRYRKITGWMPWTPSINTNSSYFHPCVCGTQNWVARWDVSVSKKFFVGKLIETHLELI